MESPAGRRRDRMFSNADKRAAALRELRFRQKVFPRLVRDGRMTEAEAERETEIMREIADDYADPNLFSGM